MNIFKKLFKRKKKCEHIWKVNKFQKLTDDGTCTYRCEKCGEYKQM